MEEIWKPVVGYEGCYEVSNLGAVRSLDRKSRHSVSGFRFQKGKRLRPVIDGHGYPYVKLCRSGIVKVIYVHRLVLLAFVGPKPQGYQACHGDGVRTNSALSNLRWDTAKGNSKDRFAHGTHTRGERNASAKLKMFDVLEIRNAEGTQRHIAKLYGISQATVSMIKSGLIWGHNNKV